MKQWISVLLFVVSGVAAFDCPAKETPKFEEGKHYIVLPRAVRTADPTRIEVTEVFRYSCPVCFEFTGKVNQWVKTLADDVAFIRNPTTAGFRQFEPHVRAYYTAQALGLTEQLHHKLFAAYQQQKKLKNQREIGDVFVAAGVDRDKFDKVFNSFGAISQSKQADSRSKGYRISGTPCIVVNGKYRIGVGTAGGQQKMLEVAKFLIEKERQSSK